MFNDKLIGHIRPGVRFTAIIFHFFYVISLSLSLSAFILNIIAMN